MQDGTREDYELLELHERDYLRTLPDRIMRALKSLETGLGGYPVSRLEHSLQAATRARRDGADTEMIVAALIHDMGDDVAPFNHAGIAAAVLRPYVRPEVTWIVEQHGLFQSYYYIHHFGGDRLGREKHREHRWYQACKDFCATGIKARSIPAIARSRSSPSSRWYARFSRVRPTIRVSSELPQRSANCASSSRCLSVRRIR
jgi:predicted HD phosphohydrolase